MTLKAQEEISLVMTDQVLALIHRCERYLRAGFAIRLLGPPGVGKTALAKHLASLLEQKSIIFHGSEGITSDQLNDQVVGFDRQFAYDNFVKRVSRGREKSRIVSSKSVIHWAAEHGHTLIYDEFNRSRPEVNNILLSILSDGLLPGGVNYGSNEPENVGVHPNFRLIVTANPRGSIGTKDVQKALLDRMVTVKVPKWNQDTEMAIIARHCSLSQEEASIVYKIIDGLRGGSSDHQWPSTRTAIRFSKIVKDFNIPFDPQNVHFQAVFEDVFYQDEDESQELGVVRTTERLLRASP